MKALKCEMCGSNDVVKQDGLYVCQNCGTKYSVEEARKMMVEGTVSIDYSSKIGTWTSLANNALNSGNNQEAYDYANKILEQTPESVDAWMIKMRSTSGLSTNGNPRTAEVISSGKNAVSFDHDKEEEVCLFFLEQGTKLLWAAANIAEETSDSIRELYRSYFQAYGKQYAINACADADRPRVEMLLNMGEKAIELERAAREMSIFMINVKVQTQGKGYIEAYKEYKYRLSIHLLKYWAPNRESINEKNDSIEKDIPKTRYIL